MVRLQNDGARARIVDQLLGVEQQRHKQKPRSDSSSLDYSVERGSHVVTPLRKRKSSEKQQQHSETLHPRVVSSTRARTNSGIPPRQNWNLEDLAALDSDQLLQLLQDHPELLSAATEQLDAETTTEQAGSRKSRDKPTYSESMGRRKSATIEDQRLDLLKKEGVPFTQWIAVLFLVLLGLYQLRQTLKAPKTTKKSKKAGRTDQPVDVDKIVATIEGVDTTEVKKKKSTKASAPAPLKKKKKPKQKSAAPKPKAKVAEPSSPPDQASTDDSSSTADATVQRLTAPIHTEPVTEEDEGGWQTVGSKSASTAIPDEPASGSTKETKPDTESLPTLQEESTDGDAALAQKLQNEEDKLAPSEATSSTTAAVEPKPPKNGSEVEPPATQNEKDGKAAATSNSNNKKSKKTKKKKPQNGKTPNGTATTATTAAAVSDDAALAQQLQNEEDKLAQADKKAATTIDAVEQATEDAWEEVGTKKKRPKA